MQIYSTTQVLPGYEISTDPARLDVDLIHRFLRTSYWAAERSREIVERSIRGSLCFGVYERSSSAAMEQGPPPAAEEAPSSIAGAQVGFARVISDQAVFAYLADVFVVPTHRGRGISKGLMRAILAHPDLQTLQVFLLRTRDAHGLYAQFGFDRLPRPEEMMVRSAAARERGDAEMS
jgi:N-acetylglutamate synthase-like GNAT family acetyltransferase